MNIRTIRMKLIILNLFKIVVAHIKNMIIQTSLYLNNTAIQT